MSKEYHDEIERMTNPNFKPEPLEEGKPITIELFQRHNNLRGRNKLKRWSRSQISEALSGELGELQNKLKKRYTQQEDIPQEEIDEEFADVLMYLCLLASKCEVHLSNATIRKYNQKLKPKL